MLIVSFTNETGSMGKNNTYHLLLFPDLTPPSSMLNLLSRIIRSLSKVYYYALYLKNHDNFIIRIRRPFFFNLSIWM